MDKFIVFDGYQYEIPPSFPTKRVILFLRHLADYQFISEYVKNKEVLDVGCGYGYGSFLLSRAAKRVTGLDFSAERIKYAQKSYKSDNLQFVTGDATRLENNLHINNFDVVVGMQLIEHIEKPELFIESTKKVAKDNGSVIIATPNRLLRIRGYQKPWNPEHFREYDPASLKDFLSAYFKSIEFHSLLGSEKVHKFSEKLRGGNTASGLTPLWRYTPEIIRRGVRKIIDSTIKEDEISLSDYEIVKGAIDEAIIFFAVCYK